MYKPKKATRFSCHPRAPRTSRGSFPKIMENMRVTMIGLQSILVSPSFKSTNVAFWEGFGG